MSDDVLATIPPPKVAAFYRRLADAVDAHKGTLKVSLAALLMRHWLDNRDDKSVFVFDAPPHLRAHGDVNDVLAYHRRVFLTIDKAHVGGSSKWAGVLPRLQGKPGYTAWTGSPPLALDYQSLVEIPVRYQVTGDDADKDLLYALHGFQLKSLVTLAGTKGAGTKVRIAFQAYQAQALDRYDWDYSKHISVPNPDFGSTDADAVSPQSRTVTVYHSNAKRLEDAGLAAPYNLKTNPWTVSDAALIAPADVDTSRSL